MYVLRQNKELNIEDTNSIAESEEGNTLVQDINTWFALRIKKPGNKRGRRRACEYHDGPSRHGLLDAFSVR